MIPIRLWVGGIFIMGLVCPPPDSIVIRKYVLRCPQCGEGPKFSTALYNRLVCSIECENKKRETDEIRGPSQKSENEKSLRRVARLAKKQKKRDLVNLRRKLNRNAQFNTAVDAEVRRRLDALQKAERYEKPHINFYLTDEWRSIRYEALKRSRRKCEVCGKGKEDGIVLHVDHIKPRSKFPELSLELENLQVLCADCNLGKSNRDSIDLRG